MGTVTEEALATKQFYRDLTVYEEATAIDFVERDTAFEDHVKTTAGYMVSAISAIEESIVKQVKSNKIISGKSYLKAKKLKASTVEIRRLLLNSFMRVYFFGKLDARQEVQASLGHRIRFQDIAKIKPEKSLKDFEKRVPVKKAEFTKMVGRERAKSFTIAGVIEQDVLKTSHQLVFQAIDQGWSVDEFAFALKKSNVKYTGTVYGTDAKKGQPLAPYHVETILRTNYADVYSQGREALFNDPDVVEFLPAYQYSAILDTRTRDSHRAMDGKIYNRDDPIWVSWTPPNGYNCFPPGTKITNRRHDVWNRPYPIEKMRVGDLVYTHLGNWKPIIEFHARLYSGDLIELKTECGFVVSCTPNHRILTEGGWKEAGELTVDDKLITYASVSARKQWVDNPERHKTQSEWAREHLPIPVGHIRKPESQRNHHCPSCGSWIKTTIGAYKEHCSIECAVKAGVYSSKLEKNPAWRGGISFEPYAPEFNKELKTSIRIRDNVQCQLCETKEGRKSVHHIDGNKKNNEPYNLVTLCDSCHGKANFNHNLIPFLTDKVAINTQVAQLKGVAICKNPGIKRYHYDGPVYNLGVADDESYAANGIIVHNCRCLKVPITSNMDYSVSTKIAAKPDTGFGAADNT